MAAPTTPQLPASEALVLAAALGDQESVVRALDQGPDWERVVRAARVHRLAPLVDHALPLRPPAPWDDALRQDSRAAAAQAARALALLDRVDAALEALTWVALKGVALGATLYGSPHLRAGSDVDVWIRQSDLDRAWAALRAAGFEPARGRSPRPLPERERQVNLVHGKGAWLDLHWGLGDPVLGIDGAQLDLAAEAGMVEVAGRPLQVPSPTHLLVVLALHAHNHGLYPALLLADLARALAAPRADLQRASQLARDMGAGLPFELAVAAARDLAGETAQLTPRARRRWRLLQSLGLTRAQALATESWRARPGADRTVAALMLERRRDAAATLIHRFAPTHEVLAERHGAHPAAVLHLLRLAGVVRRRGRRVASRQATRCRRLR